MAAAIHTHSEIQFSAGFSFRHVCNRTTKQQAQRVFSTRPHTRSARMRAFSGVPTPMAISLAPAESNFAMESLRTEASSQLRKWTDTAKVYARATTNEERTRNRLGLLTSRSTRNASAAQPRPPPARARRRQHTTTRKARQSL